MIRIHAYHQGEPPQEINASDLEAALATPEHFLWVDMGPPLEEAESILCDIFAFHPLAIEDALYERHVPRVDDWGDYLYLSLRVVDLDQLDDTAEVDLFLGSNYLVSLHDQPIPVIDKVWGQSIQDPRRPQGGRRHLLYLLVDEIANGFMQLLDGVERELEQIEDQLFEDPRPHLLEGLFSNKRVLLHLRRIVGLQGEVMYRLARSDYTVIKKPDRVFFRDVYDHYVRLRDLNESLQDLYSGALDTYLSLVNNRLNDVMKILTTFTALFLPLTFLSGFFGMNFFAPSIALNDWTGWLAFGLTLLAMLVIPLGMLIWMRRRGWM